MEIKKEPGSENEPDLSVTTSVAKHSLRFNTSIMKEKKKKKKKKCYNPYI